MEHIWGTTVAMLCNQAITQSNISADVGVVAAVYAVRSGSRELASLFLFSQRNLGNRERFLSFSLSQVAQLQRSFSRSTLR